MNKKLKILFCCEYFYPFDRGGSEWSSFYLAKGLIKKGHKVMVLTPNYGKAKNYQVWQNLKIYRFGILKKFKKDQAVSPFWQTNISWQILSSIALFKISLKEKPNIIHLQGKYFIPAGFLVKKFLKVPVVLTLRDYQILCPLGFCLGGKKSKSSHFFNFYTKELSSYLKNYFSQKNIFLKSLQIIFASRLYSIALSLRFLSKKLDKVICISKAEEKIYKKWGFDKTAAIYNSMEFKKRESLTRKKWLVFAGRLTYGKGIDLLIKAFREVVKKYPKYQLLIFGGGFLKGKIKKFTQKNQLKNKIILSGFVSRQRLLRIYQKASLVIVPSCWPEPFGRSALEAIACGTPAVVTNCGGLPEIIEDKRTGFIVSPNVNSLTKGIFKAIKNNQLLIDNIQKDFLKIKKRFNDKVLEGYEEIYQFRLE